MPQTFVFRYNRRFRHVSFETVLGVVTRRGPETYRDIIDRKPQAAVRNDSLPIGVSEISLLDRSPP
jgi:hypothetical protein